MSDVRKSGPYVREGGVKMSNKKSKEKAISPISGGAIPVPGPGRPRGAKNKLSRLAKEVITEVYERLGGIEAHIAFLKRNERALERFYTEVYPKLLSQKIDANLEISQPDNKLIIQVVETKD